MAGKRFTVAAIFEAVDRMSAPLRKMNRNTNSFVKRTERGLRNVNKRLRGMGRAIQGVTTASILGFGSLGFAMKNLVAVGAEFDQMMTSTTVRFPGMIDKSTMEFRALKDEVAATVLELGALTEFSAAEIAGAAQFQAMAGFDPQGVIKTLPGVVDLATASMTDLQRASDIATDSLGAFGLGGEKDADKLAGNLKRVSDMMAFTTVQANTTMEQLFETVKDGAPIATAAGIAMEEFLAMSGVLATAGIKGTRGGTAMKNLITNLLAPTGPGGKVLKQLGIQTVDNEGKVRSLVRIFEDLRNAMDMRGLNDADRLAVITEIFGKIPLAAAANILRDAGDKMVEFTNAIGNAPLEDFNRRLAEIQRNTPLGKFKEFASVLRTIQIETFDKLKDDIKLITEETTKWVRANKDVWVSDAVKFVRLVVDNKNNIMESVIWWGKMAITLVALAVALKTVVLVGHAFIVVQSVIAALGVAMTLKLLLLTATVVALYWSLSKIAYIFQEGWSHATMFEKVVAVMATSVLGLTTAVWFFNLALTKALIGMAIFAATNPIVLFVAAFVAATAAMVYFFDTLMREFKVIDDYLKNSAWFKFMQNKVYMPLIEQALGPTAGDGFTRDQVQDFILARQGSTSTADAVSGMSSRGASTVERQETRIVVSAENGATIRQEGAEVSGVTLENTGGGIDP